MTDNPIHLRSQLLLMQFRQGSGGAFEELVELWEKPLFYYIRRLVRKEDDAWDILQEVWIQAYRHLGQLREPEQFAAWIYRISRNAALGHLRGLRQPVEMPEEDDARTAVASNQREIVFSQEEAAAVHRALDELPLAQREVLTLFFLEDLSLQEISELTGARIGTIKSRLHYAKQLLRQILTKEGYGHE